MASKFPRWLQDKAIQQARDRGEEPIRPRVAAKAPREMNATEAAYAEHLDGLKLLGEVLDYKYESMKFRLAEGMFYMPDFLVILKGGYIEAHEVKALTEDGKLLWRDDAKDRIKMAREACPLPFRAFGVRRDRGRIVVKEEIFR